MTSPPQTNHLALGDDCELSGASRAFFFRSGDERWMKGVAKKKGGCGFHPFPCGVFFFKEHFFGASKNWHWLEVEIECCPFPSSLRTSLAPFQMLPRPVWDVEFPHVSKGRLRVCTLQTPVGCWLGLLPMMFS